MSHTLRGIKTDLYACRMGCKVLKRICIQTACVAATKNEYSLVATDAAVLKSKFYSRRAARQHLKRIFILTASRGDRKNGFACSARRAAERKNLPHKDHAGETGRSRKRMQTGLFISTTWPVSINSPVCSSRRKIWMQWLSRQAASRYLPLGVSAKPRG